MRTYKAAFATFLVAVLIMLPASGCSAAQTAAKTQNVIAGILQIAQAEVQNGVIPAQDVAIVTSFVNLGMTLDGQLGTCINGATVGGSKKAAFLACFNAFTNGLLSPAELSQLRVLSQASQSRVVLWVTAIALGVNVALDVFGGVAVPTPVSIGSAPAPSDEELTSLKIQVLQLHGGLQ